MFASLAMIVIWGLVWLWGAGTIEGAQGTTAPLPPLSWTCPHHPEVVDNKSGACPLCKVALIPVRLDLVWACPTHPTITANVPGKCRICRTDLVRMIMAVSWTCPVHPTVEALEPGACPICKRNLTAKYSIRPHGDHNPKHGGFFSMAPNNWHIEATHPARGIFRLYVYDEYSKPFIPAAFSGRVIVSDIRGVSVGGTREVDAAYIRQVRRPYLEARVPQIAVPVAVVVKVRFQSGDPEYRFDFEFHEFSKDPTPGSRASRPW